MANTVQPKGKTYIVTEPGESVNARQIATHITAANGSMMPVRRAFLNAAANTADQELVPENADAAIRIVSLAMVAGGTATEVTIKSKESGQASVAISPLIANAANGGLVLPHNVNGWFQTPDVARAVVVTTGAGSAVGIIVNFIEIPADCFDLL